MNTTIADPVEQVARQDRETNERKAQALAQEISDDRTQIENHDRPHLVELHNQLKASEARLRDLQGPGKARVETFLSETAGEVARTKAAKAASAQALSEAQKAAGTGLDARITKLEAELRNARHLRATLTLAQRTDDEAGRAAEHAVNMASRANADAGSTDVDVGALANRIKELKKEIAEIGDLDAGWRAKSAEYEAFCASAGIHAFKYSRNPT